ncbi:purple acid phosphatase family protein [Marinobacter xestospongiae]|uniref:purple acid phosphatase family protein n=1 Tax=Marinobacter xestospongiae TaxID=994319 RepID=UPI00200510C8|nr:metallophosphoesterase family protein [Marinobacter xestospongiae]MCK7567246.1 metallophosphoesterase [Marinobacter xestospongiae]
MASPIRPLLTVGISALLLAGCNNSDDDDRGAGVSDPQSDQAPAFIVRPYLQAPGTDTMTVMFETEEASPQVWARPFGSSDAFREVAAEINSDDGLVYRARLNGLSSNTLYEYFVLTGADEQQRVSQEFAFKTWPQAGDGVTEAKIIALSDTQLDREIYEVVLNNVVADGFMTEECDGSQPETCAENIAAITISGDVVQTGGTRSNWRDQLFGRMAAITPYVPLVTVPGNHDYYNNAELELYRTYMSPPDNGSVGYEEHWYYLDFLDLRLVGLDSYPISGAHGSFNRETLAVQRQWLRETLNEAEMSSKQFVMGMFHHGCLSEMWNVGESIGSCEMVTELENYSRETGAVTGHFFGHTHAYSRGQSLDAPHLWLNAASASGYIEPLNDAGHQDSQVSDYDTFEVSRSEFGYSLLTFHFGNEPSMTLERKKGGYDGDTDFNVVDQVTFRHRDHSNLPQATAGTGEVSANDVELAVQVASPEQVHEVHWQVSESADFSGPVFDIWGNDTRRHNLFYAAADQVGGDKYQGFEPIDTQQGADLFRLDLSAQLERQTIRPGADAYYRWHKRYSNQNTHASSMDAYPGQPWPELSLKPGSSYYWRARVRDTQMNWSPWSNAYSFNLAGSRSDNLLANGGGEAGDVSGWTLDSGLVSAITAANNGGFGAASGDYYFAGRGFGQGMPGDCCEDRMSQLVDVSGYADTIDAGKNYLELSARMTTWSNQDQPSLVVTLLDGSGAVIDWAGSEPRTVSSVKSWQDVTVEGFLPAGVRQIRVSVGGERKAGDDNDVYFDDLSLYLLQ